MPNHRTPRAFAEGITGVFRVSTNEHIAIIGLTGGIATGKSTVSKMLVALGVRVIDADVVAREVVEPGSKALDEIVEAFGERVLADDGSLDRPTLGTIVFADDQARATLNQITHPKIAMAMMEHARAAGRAGYRWVVYDAALIVENNIHHALAGLIVVSCSSETQVERLRSRDDLTAEEAQARIDAQLPLADKVAAADWVIDNDGTLEETRAQVETLVAKLTDRFGAFRSKKN